MKKIYLALTVAVLLGSASMQARTLTPKERAIDMGFGSKDIEKFVTAFRHWKNTAPYNQTKVYVDGKFSANTYEENKVAGLIERAIKVASLNNIHLYKKDLESLVLLIIQMESFNVAPEVAEENKVPFIEDYIVASEEVRKEVKKNPPANRAALIKLIRGWNY